MQENESKMLLPEICLVFTGTGMLHSSYSQFFR